VGAGREVTPRNLCPINRLNARSIFRGSARWASEDPIRLAGRNLTAPPNAAILLADATRARSVLCMAPSRARCSPKRNIRTGAAHVAIEPAAALLQITPPSLMGHGAAEILCSAGR
jgi:hypothetical protein